MTADARDVREVAVEVLAAHQPERFTNQGRPGLIDHNYRCRACQVGLPWARDERDAALLAHQADALAEALLRDSPAPLSSKPKETDHAG